MIQVSLKKLIRPFLNAETFEDALQEERNT